MPPPRDTSRDLLFGLLALQTGLIDQAHLVAAFHNWTRDTSRSMAEILAGQGALEATCLTLVEGLVIEHLRRHGGDPQRSLAAIGVSPSTRDRLARIGDGEIDASLAHVSSGSTEPDGDPDCTASHAVGTARADGQRFRVLRPHARGGLGAVFVALDAELHREVALKQILDSHADDPTSRQRFLLEAEITGGLEHPGVVPVYGLGTYGDGRPYYAMRFVRGDSLKEAIERFHADGALKAEPGRRSLGLRQLLRRFVDVCNAIDYAHSRGVLHRDLKPGNIIVGRHGETLVVDWGLAKATGKGEPGAEERTLVPSSAGGSAETLPGSALGTPAYMSPEQACGDLEQLGPRSDVYSLGATLYCLLTGRLPFEGGDVGAILRAVQNGEFPSPRALDPAIDPALEAVCLKAMAPGPEGRYATSRALADDVERWMADEPVSAHREGWRRRWARWARRHRALTQSAVASLLVVAATATVAAFLIGAQRNIARANHLRAEENYRLARQAVDDYLTDVSENTLLKVQDRQDLRELRRQLLRHALSYYQQFIRQRGDEPGLRAELAQAYARVGAIVQETGTIEEALRAHQQALAIWGELSRADPASPRLRRAMAGSHHHVGIVQQATGDLRPALASHRRALAIREALGEAGSAAGEAQLELAESQREVGKILGALGDRPGALRSYQEALGILTDLAQARPDDAEVLRDLANCHNDRGVLLSAADDPRATLAAFRAALGARETLARISPSAIQTQRDLANSYNNIGAVEFSLGDVAAGLASLRQAVKIQDDLARAHPSVVEFRRDVANGHYNVGIILRATGDPRAALASHRAAFETRAALTKADPSVVEFRRDLARSYSELGNAQGALGDHPEALRSYRQAVEIQEGLALVHPDDISLKSEAGATYNNLAESLFELQRLAEARDALARAITYQRSAFGAAPEVLQYRQFLSEHLSGLARAYRASHSPRQAAEAVRQRRALWPGRPAELYGVARDLASCIPLVGPSRGGPSDDAARAGRESYAAEAVGALREAVACGWNEVETIRREPAFDPLRDRPDFRVLMMDLSMPAEPFAAAR